MTWERSDVDFMRNDAFSKFHPMVNLLFFVGAIVFSVIILHPVYLGFGMVFSATYYLLQNTKKGLKTMLWLLLMFFILTAVNPLINTRGQTVLFEIFGRPYTLEALVFGACIVSVAVTTILWLGCFCKVITADKLTGIFCNIVPSLSMLLVMVFRMIPTLFFKKKQVVFSQYAIGKAPKGKGATLAQRLKVGITTLSVMSSCALEGGVVTADSMRARGYGCAKRTCFAVYRFDKCDGILTTIIIALAVVVIYSIATGKTSVEFLPGIDVASVSSMNLIGLLGYCLYMLIPIGLYVKEAFVWNILISEI